jgi:eukaryotic-like serine/threonine-protein kinase
MAPSAPPPHAAVATLDGAASVDAAPFRRRGGPRRDDPPSEQRGAVVGHYKLLQRIGEGGFGTVWMADQEQPVRRRVALKIIKAGMDTRQVIARFEQERQALAMMDHPNIARVLDAGETPAGRPYFVMELVRGLKITEFCDAPPRFSVHAR